MPDNFKGGNAHLCNCIDALLDLDAKGALVPHGMGGHARTMLEAAASRLRAAPAQAEPSVPEGYKLVPEHPTAAMKDAGAKVNAQGYDFAHHTWAQMIAAAPNR